MKKYILMAFSIGLFGNAIAKDIEAKKDDIVVKKTESTNKNNNEKQQTESKEVKKIEPITEKNFVDCEPKEKPKKITKVIKKKKITPISNVKIEDILIKKTEQTKEAPIQLNDFQSFHIPKNFQAPDVEIQNFANPITYDDIYIQSDIKFGTLYIKIKDKRTNQFLDEYYLKNNSTIETIMIDSSLNKVIGQNILYKTGTLVLEPLDINNSCKNVIVKYQLKTEQNPMYIPINIEHNNINGINEQCKTDVQLNQDSTVIDSKSMIVNFSVNQNDTTNGKIGFTSHFVLEGRDLFPNELSVYAIKKDFSEFYNLTNDAKIGKIPFMGVKVSSSVKLGDYYIIINYKNGELAESYKTTIQVR